MAGLREIVEGQAPEPAPYGLLSLRDPDVTSDGRWFDGFTYESRVCNHTVNLLDICGGLDPVAAVTPTDTDPDAAWRDYKPFGIEAYEKCTTFGFERRDVEKRAIEALELCTQKALEHEFWTGELAAANSYDANRYLASGATNDVTPVAGTPVKVRYGLALLEQALSDCGCGTRGVIHVTSEVGSVLPVKKEGDHLETQLGNYIVVGSGYTGTGPDGDPPAAGVWMYATGMVNVRLSPSEAVGTLGQQVRTNDNTWEARAQRVGAVTWDGCCVAGVLVDLALDYA